MDAGTSAVLAGAIAALAGLGGNYFVYRQTKRQMISEAQLQLREPRKRTYNDFLTACREARSALADLVDEWTHEAEAGRVEGVIGQHRPALQRTLGAVNLEGPEAVSKAAHAVMKAFDDLDHNAFLMGEIGETDDDGRPLGMRDITGGIWTALDAYVEAARKALATSADG